MKIVILIFIVFVCFAVVGVINDIEKRRKRRLSQRESSPAHVSVESDTINSPESPNDFNERCRNADIQRWCEQDFVLGYKIQRSRNCNVGCEMCRFGEGEYPLSFDWSGWHPGCLCFITPITIDLMETKEVEETFLNGGDWRSVMCKLKAKRQIKDYPDNFKLWIWKHKDDLADAIHRNGLTDFVSANKAAIDSILSGPCPDLTRYDEELKQIQRLAICESVRMELYNKERVFDDCVRLMLSTSNIDVLDRRYDLAIEIVKWVSENKPFLPETCTLVDKLATFDAKIYDNAIIRIANAIAYAADTPIKRKNAAKKIDALKSKLKSEQPENNEIDCIIESLNSIRR